MKKSIARLSILLAVLLFTGLFSACSAQPEKERELVIFTWADYYPQDILDEFTQKTGIKVIYTYFESNEEMLTKLQAVNGGDYDIVLASDYIIDIARKENLIQKLDASKIANFTNIDPAFQKKFFDPDGDLTVPYAAGTPLIIYDPAKVAFEITGYEDLWSPELKDSIVIMDDARNIVGITLKTMGYSLNTSDADALGQAGEKLMGLKGNIRAFDYNTPHEKMISGEASVGYMFTPQVLWALSERPDLKVVYPKEGMGFGIDANFIPVNAPHPQEAREFLNFILDGQISARLSEFTQYINCVTAAKEFLPAEYLNNKALYIPSDILGEAEFMQDVGADATALIDEIWTKFKQG